MDDKKIKELRGAINYLYSVARTAPVNADSHDRSLAAAELLMKELTQEDEIQEQDKEDV